MNTVLRIGNLRYTGEQTVSLLLNSGLLEPLVREILNDTAIQNVTLSKEEVLLALPGEHDLTLPIEQLDTYLAQWCVEHQIDSTRFNRYLRTLRIEKFKQLVFANRVESEFLQRKLHLDRVEYSMIHVHTTALARELMFQIRDDGVPFEQIARQYSTGQEQSRGGYMGVFALSQVPPAFLDIFRVCALGELSHPIELADGVYLIRLEQRMPATLSDSTRAELINQLYAEWLEEQVQIILNTPNAIEVQTIPFSEPECATI